MKKIISIFISCAIVGLLPGRNALRADQVEMQNGDRYVGKVLALDTNILVLKSEVLGTVRLPRSKVANVTFGANVATNVAHPPAITNSQPPAPTAALTNGAIDLSASLKALGANTNFIQQIQSQFLADAGPEANSKFNEMVSGLMSGKISVNDLRKEAKTAADQLKELKQDLGDDTGVLDSYLSILEKFLNEGAPTGNSTTNSPPRRQ